MVESSPERLTKIILQAPNDKWKTIILYNYQDTWSEEHSFCPYVIAWLLTLIENDI